jgi:hypothetical protein
MPGGRVNSATPIRLSRAFRIFLATGLSRDVPVREPSSRIRQMSVPPARANVSPALAGTKLTGTFGVSIDMFAKDRYGQLLGNITDHSRLK